MTILFTFIGAALGLVVLVVLEILSVFLFGRGLSALVGYSGFVESLIVLAGCAFGFIWGHKIKDWKEQKRINREIEQDRLRYENDKSTPN